MLIAGCGGGTPDNQRTDGFAGERRFPIPQIEYSPEEYVCYRAPEPLVIDGRTDESAWREAAATALFVDIEGDLKPAPRFATRAKMLWDDTYFYVAAEMEEPHLWGTLTERDAVIFHDNDFEVFIDPDGDTHEYYELEINALGTEWDLLLVRPYRDGAPAVNAWDIQGLKTAVHLAGTINDPTGVDSGWSVEIAIPWAVLRECAHRDTPPQDGDQWRVNFSRVEWDLDVVGGDYMKRTDSATGSPLPEYNWVWSPQGLIAMHYPEMWGIVQFSDHVVGSAPVAITLDPDRDAAWLLREIYYAQKEHYLSTGTYLASASALGVHTADLPGFDGSPKIEITTGSYEASLRRADGSGRLTIRDDGRLRRVHDN